ncbi:MAG: hypothetical protein Kow00129_03900 [Thermoleophilia bacterium]
MASNRRDTKNREADKTTAQVAQIRVVSGSHAVPFSKGLLGQSLTATGLSPFRAQQVALAVEERLLSENRLQIREDDLELLVEQVLGQMEGEDYVSRYHKWHSLALQDKPVIILIGGTTGVGKSTLATTLAHRLGIVRIIATDAIREVMRTFFSPTLMPAIHYSSFDAGGAIRIPVGKNLDRDVLGFVEQVEMVNSGVAAMIDRAVKEGTGIVMEGVHLVPGFTEVNVPQDQALVLPMVVAVRDPELHRGHFVIRDRETDGRRPFQRYLNNFEGIRKIQDFILKRAEAEGTLIIENLNIDDSVGLVVDALYDLIWAAESA